MERDFLIGATKVRDLSSQERHGRTDGQADRRTFSCLWVSHRRPYALLFYGEPSAKGATNWMLREDTACSIIAGIVCGSAR